jgi:glutathione peroxidase-family protein
MKHWIMTAALVFAGIALGQDFKLGSKIDNFTVQDLTGNPLTFSQLKGDVSVVIFISVQCPVSNAYNERMKTLYADYAPKGVHFLFLNANSTEPATVVSQHAAEHSFQFPVY